MSIGCDKCGKDHNEGVSVPSEETWCMECVTKYTPINLNVNKPTKCVCDKRKAIDYFQYVKIDRHMGFTDHDKYTFKPKFCPFCGHKIN